MRNILGTSCYSEIERLHSVALCRPAQLRVETQQEAEYVCFRETVDPERAAEAHARLVGALEANNVHVLDLADLLEEQDLLLSNQLVNRAYTRDVAGVIGNQIYFGSSGVNVRIPDFQLAQKSIRRVLNADSIYDVTHSEQATIEFGDFLILNRTTILINVGWRTNISGVMLIKDKLLETGFEQIGIISLPKDLTLPHLDVLCNVVGERTFLATRFLRHVPVKVLSSHGSYYEMLPTYIERLGYHIIYLPVNKDPLAYTNFISIDNTTILASASGTAIREVLSDCGVSIQTVEISELEKGGGGIRCLTLPLFRAD